ncbi:MAG: hypothetical protein JXR96_12900 [Deltaproteobacteria bacterium]|nr:hypothetical protein [Deltaproteobacteria bacterium]
MRAHGHSDGWSLVLPAVLAIAWLAFPARAPGQDGAPPDKATGEESEKSEAAGQAVSVEDVQRMRAQIRTLERQLEEIRERLEAEELEKLRQAADTTAASADDESESLMDRTYITASRSLQALNPEISVAGDFLAQLVVDEDFEAFYAGPHDRSGLPLRALDLHFQSTLDPFSFTKIAVGFDPAEGVGIEELYITWTGIVPQMSFTVGRFRQLFGVLNRWHEHDLDQTGYPLASQLLLGDEGLQQTGLSVKWLMPSLWAHTNELTLEVCDGENETLFSGEHFSVPTAMLHLKSYWDLSENTYLELGLSGMFGFNNRRGFEDEDREGAIVDEPWRKTFVGGADITLHWQPLQQARYRSLTWRSEGFWVSKEDLESAEYDHGWGVYSYLQYQLDAVWFVGLRGDLVEPLGSDRLHWLVVPYATFWQSEFVYIRMEFQHGEPFADCHDTRLLLQVNWAAGPHKHEKY